MHTILDLDLDFFVWPPFLDTPEEVRLPSSESARLASEVEVRSFLETQCHLSTGTPIRGYEAEQHSEAFNVWRKWIDNEGIVAPFNVVHADAHSDLGSGWPNRSCTFIETELLALPIEERRYPGFGEDYLNSGNYLLGAIANRWISQLTYVYPAAPIEADPFRPGSLPGFGDDARGLGRQLRANNEPPVTDLPPWIFRKDDRETIDWKTIELKHQRVSGRRRFGEELIHTEPPVPFECVEASRFGLVGFTHMFLAHSPEYTPVEADELLPVIREYFYGA